MNVSEWILYLQANSALYCIDDIMTRLKRDGATNG